MFFILSKTLSYLAMPLVVAVALLVVSVFLRNYRRVFFWCGLGLLLFFSNDFLANAVMTAWEPEPVPIAALDSAYAFGIVLTGVTMERDPSDRVYFQKGADRITQAVQLYKAGRVKKLLISGGSGRLLTKRSPEADELAAFAEMMGVPANDIVIENRSRNTHESSVNVRTILWERGVDSRRCLLITSAFHMSRSLGCFYKQGLTPKPFPVDYYSHPAEWTPDVFLFPKPEALILWQKLFKEWLGITAYRLAGYI